MPPLMLGCFAVLVYFAVYLSGLSVAAGDLHDTDCYMRMVQVEKLIDSGPGGWQDHIIRRDNAPYGLEMHWSRPVDLGLISLYLPLRCILSAPQSLLIAGIAFSTLLLFPCLLLIDRVAREHLPLEGRMLMMLLFALQPGILNYYAAGRPDHHALILTCFLGSLCSSVLAIKHTHQLKYFIYAAGWTALGLWTSVEALVTWLCLSACFTIAWLAHTRTARPIAYFHTIVFLASMLCIVTETPDLLMRDFPLDRLCGIHCLFFGLIAGCWWILILIQGSLVKKIAVGTLCSVVAVSIISLIFPKLWSGPFGQVDAQLKSLWLNHVQELHLLGNDFSSLLIGILAWIPSLIPGLITVCYLIMNRRRWSPHHVILGLSWLLVTGVTTFLAIYQKRWIAYAGIMWAPMAALGLYTLFTRIESKRCFRLYRTLILMFVCGGPVTLAVYLEKDPQLTPKLTASAAGPLAHPRPVEPVSSLSAYIASNSYINTDNSTVLAFMDLGPELLYRTNVHTVASPYHRNTQGIIDGYNTLSAKEEQAPLKIIRKRNINWIVVGANPAEASFYGTEGTLFKHLLQYDAPDWLLHHASVMTSNGQYIIYKVLPDSETQNTIK